MHKTSNECQETLTVKIFILVTECKGSKFPCVFPITSRLHYFWMKAFSFPLVWRICRLASVCLALSEDRSVKGYVFVHFHSLCFLSINLWVPADPRRFLLGSVYKWVLFFIIASLIIFLKTINYISSLLQWYDRGLSKINFRVSLWSCNKCHDAMIL